MELYLGDCLEEMKKIPDGSVDLVLTDPPYELGFMGKSWDSTGIANNVDVWKECLRVLKPGGYLLSFGGTRTYHRMASAIEDAGFEVRDMIEWVYGSGFPKSLNIGKAVDKLQGNEREQTTNNVTCPDFPNPCKGHPTANRSLGGGANRHALPTKGNSEWEGWGTALKPAHEPICMARKPLSEKTVAENVLKWGTGGINIDESRVESGEDMSNIKAYGSMPGATGDDKGWTRPWMNDKQSILDKQNAAIDKMKSLGRFPANLIHDNSEEVRECFPETKSKGHNPAMGKANPFGGDNDNPQEESYFNDSGNASRFFKSIMTDSLCTLCCLPFDIKHDTMSVCNNTNANNAEKSSETTQATTEVIAPQNATTTDSKKFVQSVRSVANLCDLCGTYIALVLAGGKPVHQEEEARGQIFITKHKKQILDNALAFFVELRGKKDTTPTINNLNLLFGYVFNAIENSTTYYEQEKEEGKIHEWKSLLYQAKASKRDRGDGNNHPTVKPVALMEYLITMTSRDGATILDPFMGSGTTAVACKRLNRNFIGIEMDETYFNIAKERIDNA